MMGFAVGIKSISQFLANFQVFPVYSSFFCDRHFKIPAEIDVAR